MEKTIINFDQIDMRDLSKVGGKNASLGEMIKHLQSLGVKVPGGFATTASAYKRFLATANLESKIYQALSTITLNDLSNLDQVASTIRKWIIQKPLPSDFINEITQAYKDLGENKEIAVAVRSSATLEDLPEASFAGQQETFLNVVGAENVVHAVKKVFASLFTERAIIYRIHHNFKHENVAISVGIQRMIRSSKSVSGVMFTLDTESGFDQVILINSSYGLGESIVQGSVNPDEFIVSKPLVRSNFYPILSKKLGAKKHKVISTEDQGEAVTSIVPVSLQDQAHYSLTDQEITSLARQALLIEEHYGKAMDIEWAKDYEDLQLYILQARPETVASLKPKNIIERYQLQKKTSVLTKGHSVGQKIAQGYARVIKETKQMDLLKEGEILVTDITDPDWEPIMKRAGAIVTNRGGRTCHAAIVARELGIPAVVGCQDATLRIKDSDEITVSCAEGEEGYIYPGLIPFTKEEIAVESLPKLSVKICLILADPYQAFSLQFLPNEGVGLARLEFIINQMIGIHPNAILNMDKIDSTTRDEILQKTAAYSSPTEFYIEKLREGMATIAASFYPKQVIFRFSDFKSNEYANLLGGKSFEPLEENPMLGFRGASRYASGRFEDSFALECESFKRVRNKMNLTNAQVMVPFVRTIEELKAVISVMSNLGLKRGENDLKVYMMCEIPSNALLADEFLNYVDGFSIGSNDLTQLTLGIDRDSELVSASFDERNLAIKKLLHLAISACKERNKYIGICGQAPSDYPEFAKWLVEEKIESISLNPDTVIKTWLFLAGKNDH
jgi:pyruvate,water dikinase